jgi:dienelactone hydrolase
MESIEKEISFDSEDGWRIYGTLHLPELSRDRAAAALLLHGPGHDRDAFASFVYPGMAQILASLGVAALRIDWRGRGQSIGKQEYHAFTPAQRADIGMDVTAALEFLASQPEIDADRIAVFAEETSGEWAVKGAMRNAGVKAFAFISGRLSQEARELLAGNHLPVLCIVSSEDKHSFADMSDVFAASRNPESDFRVYENMGMGTTMFTLWRYKYPDKKGVEFLASAQGVDTEKIGLIPRDPGNEKPIENVICDWIADRLKALGRTREVSFRSEDGWTIHGKLLIPDGLPEDESAPGIVLLHSGVSDRSIFHSLEKRFVRSGIAALSIDWRGRGQSRGKGNYFKLPREERDAAHLDAKAAIDFLARQPEVASERIAVLGVYLGAKLAVAAALTDARVKALIMLSGYIPSGKEREQIAEAHFPMLLIGSRGFAPVTNALADLYELTRDRGSELIVYDGGALGCQLFEVDENLEQSVVVWTRGKLS